ncbi:MAG: DUF7283 family protein [Halolamina sp.]
MNEIPADVPPIWIALLVVSATVLGVVLALPSAPPPDATRVADSVDEVAATDHTAAAAVPIDATAVRLSGNRVGLRGEGGTAHASLQYGPVTPVPRESDLSAVLHGTPPADVFDSPSAFRAALDRARTSDPEWVPAGQEIRIRRVEYGEVSDVLVGQ